MSSPYEIIVRFPTGRYHATPWTSSANSLDVEWPPSPWRLLRALLAVWHTKLPHIPAEHIDQILAQLRGLPIYRLPAASLTHTRHYFPLAEFDGSTDKIKKSATFAPHLALHPDRSELRIRWESVSLSPELRGELDSLWEHLTYLGRAESTCEITVARELEAIDDETIDREWTVPQAGGGVEVLALTSRTTRKELELTTAQMRKSRNKFPATSTFVEYHNPRPLSDEVMTSRTNRTKRSSGNSDMSVFRFRLRSAAPIAAYQGILATEALRSAVFNSLRRFDPVTQKLLSPSDSDINTWIHGHRPSEEMPGFAQHETAHWLWLPDVSDGTVSDVVMWVPRFAENPAELSLDDYRRIVRRFTTVQVSASRNIDADDSGHGDGDTLSDTEPSSQQARERSYFPRPTFELEQVGSVDTTLGRYFASGTTWTSVTPYLPVRFRKPKRDRDLLTFLADDIRVQLEHRRSDVHSLADKLTNIELVDPDQVGTYPISWDTNKWSRWALYRRYRRGETMANRRSAFWLRLTFSQDVAGPISLGHHSHFGFGLFATV